VPIGIRLDTVCGLAEASANALMRSARGKQTLMIPGLWIGRDSLGHGYEEVAEPAVRGMAV
jgi:hypothetical protein